MSKKLQLALDVATSDIAMKLLEQVSNYVDIIEIGTPLIISEGMRTVRRVRERYPNHIIFADTKIMDAGTIVANIALEAGADIISVVACTENNTIKAAIDAAHKRGRQCLVDMVATQDIPTRARELEELCPDYMATHIGYDIRNQNIDPIKELYKLDGINIPKAIAGGITLDLIPAALKSNADIIIVGEGIYNQTSPHIVAKKMQLLIQTANKTLHNKIISGQDEGF